jgi:hypothetical protein
LLAEEEHNNSNGTRGWIVGEDSYMGKEGRKERGMGRRKTDSE